MDPGLLSLASQVPDEELTGSTLQYSLAWFGMVWHGLAWFGMVWHGLAWFGMV